MQAAIARWQAVVGAAHVVVDEAVLAAAARGTYPTTPRAVAIVRPGSVLEVQACVRVAAECAVPLHPLGRGRNWGYGSRVPRRDGAALLDLARLDRIVDFDERLAYVTVEAGVTFRQLARYLRGCRARVFASVTGATADGSVVGNALERGDGAGPLGDRIEHVCGLEVVLGDGSIVHTGYGRFAKATVAPLAKAGLGPSLDGLFAQSGLGIVTRMTIWLTPYPAWFQAVTFVADDEAALPALVDAGRKLRLAGVVTSTLPLWNDYKALALLGQYPWAQTSATPLPDELRRAARAGAGLGRWNGTLPIYGASRAHGLALRAAIDEALAPHATLVGHDGPSDPLAADETACGPHLGVPHDRGLVSMYWRKRRPPPAAPDPDADGCGFRWLSHALPFDGAHARAVVRLVEAELFDAGFEPQIALLGITPRVLSLVASLSYDRDVDGEDARAMAVHRRVFDALVAHGYPPFRDGVDRPAIEGEPAYEGVLARLTDALDPHGTLRRG